MENVCKNQKIEILYFIMQKESIYYQTSQKSISKANHKAKQSIKQSVIKKMSSYQKASAKKQFCKVCHDAGKPENVYTSHFVKDKQGPDGKVVCPYLLSLTCAYCKKQEGHTAKHCPNLLAKQQSQPQQAKQPQQQQQAKQQSQPQQAKQPQQQPQAKQQQQAKQSQVQAKPTLHEHDDGWSRVGKKALVVVLDKKEEPEKKVVVVAVPKKVSLMAAFIEEDEKKDEEKEKSIILEERKRIQFESEFPSLPVTKKVKLSPPEKVENKAPEPAVFEYNFSGGSWADYDD